MTPINSGLAIVPAGKHFSNTNLSDLSIVGTCDILFIDSVIKSCELPDWLIQTCYQSASSRVTETTFLTQKKIQCRKSYHCYAKYCNTNHCYCLATKDYLISP